MDRRTAHARPERNIERASRDSAQFCSRSVDRPNGPGRGLLGRCAIAPSNLAETAALSPRASTRQRQGREGKRRWLRHELELQDGRLIERNARGGPGRTLVQENIDAGADFGLRVNSWRLRKAAQSHKFHQQVSLRWVVVERRLKAWAVREGARPRGGPRA